MGLYDEILKEQKKKKKEENIQKYQALIEERDRQINLPTYTETKPSPFITENRTANNPNNMEKVNQRLKNLKNYSKNKEIQDLAHEIRGESLEDKIAKGIKGIIDNSYLKDGYQFGDLLRTSLSTKKNIATNAWHGLGKSLENFYDFSLNASSNINTALNEKLGIQTKEQAANERKAAQDIIKRDLTTDVENALGFDEEAKKKWENGSLVRRDNLGGKVAQGVGEMIPQLLIGGSLGGTETQWKALNFGKKLVASAPTNLGIGITSYGGGLEEAYSEGATTSQANRFALGSALVEMGTEWLTDGVPGLPQTGIFDKWTDKALDKTSNSMAKFLLKQGFTFLGEGGEEGLSEIIKPYLQNATYTSGREINWNDVFESFVVGGLVGDMLELPGNLSNYHADVNALKEEFNRELSNEAVNTAIDKYNLQQQQFTIPTIQNTSQNTLNVPTTTDINTNEDINPLENIEEFKTKQKGIKNQQVQEETNNRINTLEEQLEKQGNRILEESEAQKQAMIESFKEYLEEHNITNPTQQDINDSITDIMSYDNDLDFADTARAEQLYNKYVKEYMQENGIPFNNENNSYRGSHQIENAKKLVDLNIKDIQNKVEAVNGYLTQQDQTDLRKLNKIFNHPEEDIKVYRASPVNELNSGDWITTDRAYAKNVAQNNGGKVYEYTIKPSQLYYPDNVNDLPSLHRLSSFQYIENQPNIPTARDFNQNINMPAVEKNDNMVYNESNPEYIGLISAIPEIKDYSKYSMLKKWLDKPINELKRVSRMLANDAIIKKNMGFNSSEYIDVDGKTVYDYDITGDEYIFRVKNIYEYTNEMEEIYERNVEQNSQTIISNEPQGQSIESNSDVMLPNTKESRIDDRISREKYEEWFNKKQNKGKSNRNKGDELRELDNSSFSLPKNPTKESSYEDTKEYKKTRKSVQEELKQEMGITLDDIAVGKDISALEFQRTDPIRLNEKVFGAEIGQKINDATINKTKHNEAERTRFLNKEREEISKLGIKARSKESAAVQKYGEKQYVTDKGEIVKYGDKELANEFPDVKTQEKIKHVAQILRNKYDTYIEQINNVITEMGYDPIPKRPDYMRHFQEINDKLSQWGIPLNPTDMSKDALPTDINGITDQFKPGKNWFASAIQRKGFKTTYDAITGIDGYLEGASNLIYHTPDIQRYRALSKFIRDTYGQTHGMDNIDVNTEEGQKRLNDIFDNKLSKYAAWLDEQANALAGKKGGIDRAAERLLGRKVYTVLDSAKKQVGSNMTGFNVRSALTNFASAVQGAAKTKKIAFLKGTVSTLKNIIHNDGLINKSDFLTNRFGSDQLSKKLWQKASNAGQIFMTGSDYFTANQIWRSKYYENLASGMSEEQAIKKADDFAARIMGDRSKGSTAEVFNSKTLGLLTQFQLEVNNQWSSIIHDNKMDLKTGNKSGATVMFQLGQLAAMSFFFNNFMKSLTGSDVMIDPIDMLKKMIGSGDDDEEKSLEERTQEVLGDLWNDLPFASFMTGGRIPMKEAFKGGETLLNYATGQKNSYGQKYSVDDVKKDLAESAFYWLLPTGYGQVKKTSKGLKMYDSSLPMPGSYTDSGNLRFRADESTGGKIKAALFGQYSSKESQKYMDSGYKAINKSRLDEVKELDMSASDYRKYREALNKAGTTNADKIEFIANSDYTDKEKNIMAKNILGRDFNIDEYEKYDSYEEYNYATKYPDKYSVIKQIAPYDRYNTYKDDIKNIRDNTTNDRAETIKYINSLNMNIPQKAMFIKQYYKSYTKYDKEIVQYINQQRLTAKEKEQVLTQLGFTVKDGRVYY